jgi:hypothetical protein
MARYTMKPLEFEAEVFKLGMEDGFEDIIPDDMNPEPHFAEGSDIALFPFVNTVIGKMFVGHGDYIATTVEAGEINPRMVYPANVFAQVFTATEVTLEQEEHY